VRQPATGAAVVPAATPIVSRWCTLAIAASLTAAGCAAQSARSAAGPRLDAAARYDAWWCLDVDRGGRQRRSSNPWRRSQPAEAWC